MKRLVAFLILIIGCYEDNGMLPGICGPVVLPMEVYSDDVDPQVVLDAVNIWNSRSPINLFQIADFVDGDCLWEDCLGLIVVSVNWPEDDDALADASVWAPRGEILSCSIRVTPAWPPDTMVLAHELGHCLGLAHDDDPDSLMSSPTRSWAIPTESDIRLVLDRSCGG